MSSRHARRAWMTHGSCTSQKALHRAMRGLLELHVGSPVAVSGRCRSPYLGALKYRRVVRAHPPPLARFPPSPSPRSPTVRFSPSPVAHS